MNFVIGGAVIASALICGVAGNAWGEGVRRTRIQSLLTMAYWLLLIAGGGILAVAVMNNG